MERSEVRRALVVEAVPPNSWQLEIKVKLPPRRPFYRRPLVSEGECAVSRGESKVNRR